MINNTDYNVQVSYNYNYPNYNTYDYYDYSDNYYDSYWDDSYYNSYPYYSNSYDLYQREKAAEIAQQDAQIATLKAKLARLKYRNAPKYVIIQAERNLQDAIYDRYPNLRYNPKAASDLLVGMGIVFIVAGLLNS
jgi:hypothetical protein